MDSNGVQGRRYRLVLRGELGDAFGILFDGMQLRRLAGMTVLTGQVTDQAHLAGPIEQIQELGAELISVTPDQRNGRRCSGSRDRTRLVMMAHRHARSEPSPAGPSPSSSCTGSALGQMLEVHDPELWLTRAGGDRGGSHLRQCAGCCRAEQRAGGA